MLVFPEVDYVLYSELGVYILGDIKGERIFTDKSIRKHDMSYKKRIYTLEFDKQHIPISLIPNINVLLHEQNGNVEFDDVLRCLTPNGVSKPYKTHFASVPHTTNDNSVYLYIGNYSHNTVVV